MALYRFSEGLEFDVASGELRRDEMITRLEPQPAAVLALLASRAGEVVTHAEIKRSVWGGGTHVNFQDSVHYCVRQIRMALGDRAQDPRFIDTIPRRGYRFRAETILPDELLTATSPRPPISAEAPRPHVARRYGTWRQRLAMVCLAAVVGGAIAVVERRPNDHHQIAAAMLKTVHDLVF